MNDFLVSNFRSSHRRCCFKKGAFNNFAKFIANLLRHVPEACYFIKRETPTQVLSSEFCGIFKNTLYTEHLRTISSTVQVVYVLRNVFKRSYKPSMMEHFGENGERLQAVNYFPKHLLHRCQICLILCFDCVPMIIPYHLYFLRITKVSSMLHHGSVG